MTAGTNPIPNLDPNLDPEEFDHQQSEKGDNNSEDEESELSEDNEDNDNSGAEIGMDNNEVYYGI